MHRSPSAKNPKKPKRRKRERTNRHTRTPTHGQTHAHTHKTQTDRHTQTHAHHPQAGRSEAAEEQGRSYDIFESMPPEYSSTPQTRMRDNMFWIHATCCRPRSADAYQGRHTTISCIGSCCGFVPCQATAAINRFAACCPAATIQQHLCENRSLSVAKSDWRRRLAQQEGCSFRQEGRSFRQEGPGAV